MLVSVCMGLRSSSVANGGVCWRSFDCFCFGLECDSRFKILCADGVCFEELPGESDCVFCVQVDVEGGVVVLMSFLVYHLVCSIRWKWGCRYSDVVAFVSSLSGVTFVDVLSSWFYCCSAAPSSVSFKYLSSCCSAASPPVSCKQNSDL